MPLRADCYAYLSIKELKGVRWQELSGYNCKLAANYPHLQGCTKLLVQESSVAEPVHICAAPRKCFVSATP
jgi:hypothetical protein